ncbi:glycoside hydrolase family 19 protein [Roseateles sp. MS654]|uniref:glycoside hydrolase family 19 protein n=1 Tax=Roseateles sp. MS654 TaxID=3412685 RepID=UPI003C2EC69C
MSAGWLSVSDRLAASNLITPAQLKKLFELASSDLLAKVADEVNRRPSAYHLDTKLRRAHFFAQVREEAGPSMDAKIEDLTYSPAALKGLFGYYGKHPDEADTDGYERGPKGTFKRKASQEDIANKAYSNRNGNGDQKSGDGWKYRGRGFIQVTGRSNYAAVSAKYASVFGDASVDFERDPELVATFPYSLRSAICYWLINGLYRLADKGSSANDVDRVTRVVNANTHSYKERQNHFKTAYEHFE